MDSDEALFDRVRRGDMGAFDVLYARYETRLFGFLMGRLWRREDAEDVFHEAFLATLQAGPLVFDPARGGGFRAYLYRVAHNKAENRLRSDRRAARAIASMTTEEPTAPAGDRELDDRELASALEGAVLRLPPALGEVYRLRTAGLSYDEIATVLETPVGTVKSRIHQMVSRLREELKPWTAR